MACKWPLASPVPCPCPLFTPVQPREDPQSPYSHSRHTLFARGIANTLRGRQGLSGRCLGGNVLRWGCGVGVYGTQPVSSVTRPGFLLASRVAGSPLLLPINPPSTILPFTHPLPHIDRSLFYSTRPQRTLHYHPLIRLLFPVPPSTLLSTSIFTFFTFTTLATVHNLFGEGKTTQEQHSFLV